MANTIAVSPAGPGLRRGFLDPPDPFGPWENGLLGNWNELIPLLYLVLGLLSIR